MAGYPKKAWSSDTNTIKGNMELREGMCHFQYLFNYMLFVFLRVENFKFCFYL